MDDLVIWLRAQLDDDERLARAAAHGPWEYQDIESVGGGRVCDPDVAIATVIWDNSQVDPRIRRSVRWQEADRTGEHIARHDPARVLAEVDTKRRILDMYVLDYDADGHAFVVGGYGEAWREAVRLLALPYATRPGYRDEWKPPTSVMGG